MFEYIYFSRPDSIFEGRNVYDVRKKIGHQLASENLSDKDIVDVNIPTGIPLAYNISDNNIEKIGYLGDEEAINNLAKEVEMQSKITDKKG